MTKNSPNPYKCHHMQCIFDPKMAKTRIFSDTTLLFDDSKQFSSVSDKALENLMCRFEENVRKNDF